MFWTTHGLVGEGPNAVIQKLTNLKKQPGDTINFGLTTKLSGSGVSGDSTLEGYEEAISSYAETVTVNRSATPSASPGTSRNSRPATTCGRTPRRS